MGLEKVDIDKTLLIMRTRLEMVNGATLIANQTEIYRSLCILVEVCQAQQLAIENLKKGKA